MAGADKLPTLGALPSIGKANTGSELPSIAMGGGRGNFYIDEQSKKKTLAMQNALSFNEFDNMDLSSSMKAKDPNEGKSM
jgi:hypothetical protein